MDQTQIRTCQFMKPPDACHRLGTMWVGKLAILVCDHHYNLLEKARAKMIRLALEAKEANKK